jgi:hypothetical protein
MKLRKQLLFLIVPLIVSMPLFGQIKVYNVESTTSKEFEIGTKISFSIVTNKADITVIPTTNKAIKITAVFSSKNEDKQLAENDLKLQKHLINKKSNTISIVNYVEISSGAAKPTSNLKASFVIEVPQTIVGEFKIKNDFGKIEFSNITANASIESKFCPITISNYSGSLRLDSYYGDIDLKSITGALAITTKHSKLGIENHSGDFTIKSSFSKLNLININPEQTSTIVDDHSEINLVHSCLSCNYILFDLEKSEFNFPHSATVSYSIKEEFKIIGSLFNSKPSRIIDIKSNTGIVSLKALSK